MIISYKMLWAVFKRVHVTFLEWYPIIYAWVSTEIRQLTTILKFCPKICFLYIVCKAFIYDSCSCVCQVRETIEFGPFWLRYYAWLSTCDQNMSFPSRRASRFLGSNFKTLIMLGKLLSSPSDRKFGSSCFSEHMIEKNCENKGQL